MIDPPDLALVLPWLRPLVARLAPLPPGERAAALKSWCDEQPDAEEIWRGVLEADPDAPPPGLSPTGRPKAAARA